MFLGSSGFVGKIWQVFFMFLIRGFLGVSGVFLNKFSKWMYINGSICFSRFCSIEVFLPGRSSSSLTCVPGVSV